MEIQCRSCSLRCTPFCYVDPQECFNLSYEDEILINDDLSESSLAYAVPHDSVTNREGQGAESSAKSCSMLPFDAPCIGCGNCK